MVADVPNELRPHTLHRIGVRIAPAVGDCESSPDLGLGFWSPRDRAGDHLAGTLHVVHTEIETGKIVHVETKPIIKWAWSASLRRGPFLPPRASDSRHESVLGYA